MIGYCIIYTGLSILTKKRHRESSPYLKMINIQLNKLTSS